jgi:exodeoxyribonuclease VII small subunit
VAKPKAQTTDDAPFESLMSGLESIVMKLEKGELSLEESLTAYEEGVRLVRRAQSRLDVMDKRLSELLADGTLAPLDLDDDVAPLKSDGSVE